MGKIDTKLNELWEECKNSNIDITKSVLAEACEYLGPNLFRKDASLVAFSEKEELETIKDNFVKKKLQVTDSDEEIHAAIKKVGEKYGMSNRNKKRAIVYAMLMSHYDVKTL